VLQKCQVSEQDVHCALLSGDPQDQLVIAYNLVIDNRRIADETAKLQIRDFYLASSPPSESQLAVSISLTKLMMYHDRTQSHSLHNTLQPCYNGLLTFVYSTMNVLSDFVYRSLQCAAK